MTRESRTKKTTELVENVPEWITGHTGYSVVRKGDVFKVAGKTIGNEKLFPYGDPAYRKAHKL